MATAARQDGRSDRAVAIWLLACCAMIFLMVVIGGLTRLTLSGLSITEWEPVAGAVPPLSAADWANEFEKYRQIPQYRALNAGMSLSDFKVIYLWEYTHRLWGRLIGLVYLLPFLYFVVRRRVPRRLAWPLAGIFVLGAAQGALGWYMVKSGLATRVDVSQYRLTAHLALALAIYAATLWAALGLLRARALDRAKDCHPGESRAPFVNGPRRGNMGPGFRQYDGYKGEHGTWRWRRASEAVLGLVALTIVAGGFTAGLHAGLIYNSFPRMGGGVVPAEYGALTPFLRNWFENAAAVQFDHRLLATTTVLSVAALWLTGLCAKLPGPVRLALHALMAAVALQFALGLTTLLLVVPLPIAAIHQAGAVILLTAALVLRHTLRAGTPP